MEDLQRIGVKLFCSTEDSIDLVELIPIFHRWIQAAAVDDMLIDVADYSHVPDGPGILLVGHEGIYAMDETDGRRGMAYYFRRPEAEGLTERLLIAAHRVLAACRRLEAEPELGGKLTFDTGELELFVNDLGAPISGPVLFVDGVPASGLTYTFGGLGDGSDDLMFDDGSLAFTYIPAPGADGYDPNVTAVQINPKGAFSGAGGGNPFFELRFQARVR